MGEPLDTIGIAAIIVIGSSGSTSTEGAAGGVDETRVWVDCEGSCAGACDTGV
jgi:hypothetical protein